MIITSSVTSIRRHVYIYGSIDFPEDYEAEIAAWDSEWSYPNEEVILHINSYGGSVDSMKMLQHRFSQVGKLGAIVEGVCMSAALTLYLTAQKRAATKDSLFMAHNAILSNNGRNEEVQIKNLHEYTEYIAAQSRESLKESLYIPKFITKRELEDIVNGNELYMDFQSAKTRGIINCDISDIPLR